MSDYKELHDRISESFMAAYAGVPPMSVLEKLRQNLEAWDDFDYPGKDRYGEKLIEDLRSLISHFDRKGLKEQSDEVFRLMLHIFPESHFSEVPVQAEKVEVDFNVFKTAQLDVDDDQKVLDVRQSMAAFEKNYRIVLKKMERFIREVELKLFREGGTSEAGNLYKAFERAAASVAGTSMSDAPFLLINQLALKLNNEHKAFNQACGIIREALRLKDNKPSEQLEAEMKKNERFFLRNYYWRRIDDAVASGDNSRMVYYIDRLLPMVQVGHEKSNLIMLRANAIKRNDEPVKGCVLYFVIGVFLMLVLSVMLSTPSKGKGGKGSDKPQSRWDKFWSMFLPEGKPPEGITFSIDNSEKVPNKAGLDEVKPPPGEKNRKLTLEEIRHVVFQKVRLEYLSQQELTEEEMEILNKLWEEWKKRGEFYEYDAEDRERAEIEAQRNMTSLLEDAEDIREQINEKKDQEGSEDSESSDEKNDSNDESEKFDEHRFLLSLDNPAHVRRILGKLRDLGYFQGNVNGGVWDDNARKALIKFKVSRMSKLDGTWDLPTQDALLNR